MNKGVKISLIIIIILMVLFLGYNIYTYNNYKKEINSFKEKEDTIKNNAMLLINEKKELEKEISSLEENNQDKLKLYNKWKSHKEDLIEKMN